MKIGMDDRPISSRADVQSFWTLAKRLSLMTERERISRIRSGFATTWILATKTAFDLDESAIASFADMSVRTLGQRLNRATLLAPSASERFDRLAQLALLSENIFEARAAAEDWIAAPNDSLGGKSPFLLCRTELGGRQAYRVLRAIEWGGSV
ncbi:antitoxin [Pseudomonas sp. WN033]|nr:antitoxin [Pseudomonas sp. WN033]